MIAIHFPDDIEARLRANLGRDLDQIARKAIIVEGYRSGAISIGQAARLLDTSIDATYGVMKSHGVHLRYGLEDYEEDRASLKRLFPDAPL